MRLDRRSTNIALALNNKRQIDIVKAGIPRGTVNSAMQENRISAETAQKIADAIGVDVSMITQKEG